MKRRIKTKNHKTQSLSFFRYFYVLELIEKEETARNFRLFSSASSKIIKTK